jgi:protein O-GlcNAc transferase
MTGDAPPPNPPPAGMSFADAFNLGVQLFNERRLGEAASVAEAILRVHPENPDALHLGGVISQAFGDFDQAIRLIRRALDGKRTALFLSNLAGALISGNRHGEALPVLEEAATLDPASANIAFNTGVVLRALGRPGDAAAAFGRAGVREPGMAAAHHTRGLVLMDARRPEAAADAFRATLAADPAHADAWTGLGVALNQTGRRLPAIRLHHRACLIDPAKLDSAVHALDIVRCCLRFDLIETARADLVAALTAALPRGPGWRLLSSVLYRHLYRPLPPAVRAAAQQAFDRSLAAEAPPSPVAAPPVAAPSVIAGPADRLRVGYLSANLNNHPIGQVTLSLFAAHDRRRVEVHGFTRVAGMSPADTYAARHRAGFDHVHDTDGLDGRRLADSIRAADLDVLVYLDGHMDKEGLVAMAHRPARAQAFWLGHAGGIGRVAADYLLADRIVVPPGEEGLYDEALVRLPPCYHVADRHAINAVRSRAAYGLPDDAVVFCAFNNAEKIDQAAFFCWMEIMRRVENSVLWLSRSGVQPEQTDSLSRFAAACGVDPRRIIPATREPDKGDHLARHQAADLFLDTWTMNASTTALDALWAGLPMITLAGDCFSNRIAGSMLTALGLPELICPTPTAYAAMATALALNPQALQALRARLWRNRETTSLFDVGPFAAKLEDAYFRMREISRSGRRPEAFDMDV